MIRKQNTRKLVADECANYFNDGYYCCVKDGKCVYFDLDDPRDRCRYFENNVLPLDKDYEAIYRQELIQGKMSEAEKQEIVKAHREKNKIRKTCQQCRKIFLAESNRQRFCPDCKKTVRRQYQRDLMQKRRNEG
jgi:hypothetical protein